MTTWSLVKWSDTTGSMPGRRVNSKHIRVVGESLVFFDDFSEEPVAIYPARVFSVTRQS